MIRRQRAEIKTRVIGAADEYCEENVQNTKCVIGVKQVWCPPKSVLMRTKADMDLLAKAVEKIYDNAKELL